jgi:hypothetical protein
MATLIFMRLWLRPRVPLEPELWAVFKCFGCDIFQHCRGNPDIRYDRGTAEAAAGKEYVTRFLAEKRDGNLGLGSRSADFTCRSIKTARHINGANWELPSLHLLDHLCRRAVDRACQACAEYCVDHGTGSVQDFQAERLDRTPPQPGVMRCIAF